MSLAKRDQFYSPASRPRLALPPQVGAPSGPPGYAVIPLASVLTIANNIQAAVKARREGQVSPAVGDPEDFILKLAEDLRMMAIRMTKSE